MLSWFRRDKPAPKPPAEANPPPQPLAPPSSGGGTDSEAVRKSGNALLNQGQIEQALRAYRQAIELDRSNQGAWGQPWLRAQ
jgi:tetratricopeptide (TPR) repeat protein